MRKLVLIIAFLCSSLPAFAQQTPYVYERKLGQEITFAWDHSLIPFDCAQVGRETSSFTCNDKTYTVVWTGDSVQITGADFSYSARVKYKYRGIVEGGITQIAITAKGPGAYPFTVPASGKYEIWGYVQVDNMDGACDSFFTKLDAGAETIWDTPNSATPGAWVWDKINDRAASDPGALPAPIVYDLASGQHTVYLRERERCTRLDGLKVTPAGSSLATEVFAAETTDNQAKVSIIILGDIRMEVAAVLVKDGVEHESSYSKSTDPAVSTVGGVARGWLVKTAIHEPHDVVIE